MTRDERITVIAAILAELGVKPDEAVREKAERIFSSAMPELAGDHPTHFLGAWTMDEIEIEALLHNLRMANSLPPRDYRSKMN